MRMLAPSAECVLMFRVCSLPFSLVFSSVFTSVFTSVFSSVFSCTQTGRHEDYADAITVYIGAGQVLAGGLLNFSMLALLNYSMLTLLNHIGLDSRAMSAR